jgi:hypothetical protein
VQQESREDYPEYVRGESLIALAMIDGAAARACLEKRAPDKKTEFHVKAAACVVAGEDKACQALVDYGRTQCAGMGFPSFIVPKYIDDWAGDRRERKKWPKALSAALRACEKANEKSK